KAADAYNKTLNGLTAPLQQALKNMVDTNNNNATSFQILMIDKMVENLKDFPADKRKKFIAERDRLKRQLSGYNADHTEKSNKLLNEGVFGTIAYLVKQIVADTKGAAHKLEALDATVVMTSNLIEFRTHKGLKEAPYFHQGTDFSAWGHEGILYCPKTFPTKNGDMLEADEIFVLNVEGEKPDPADNYLTIAMVNHKKGIVFSTYHHAFTISVKAGDKIKPGHVLGNYWKYKKKLAIDSLTQIGYAKRPNADKPSLTGSSSSGDYIIYQKQHTSKFYAKKNGNPHYYLLKQDSLTTANIDGKALKFRNEHFHVERRFVSKQKYLTEYLGASEALSLQNATLSQSSLTKHFGKHAQIKKLVLNSSFGDLIPASALLDTGSIDSKILLDELKKLRGDNPHKAALEKAYSQKVDTDALAKIIAAAEDSMIRDYTTLLMFEKIVKLGCELQGYAKKADNCNLSQLQRNITDAKQVITNKKFKKYQ
nr:M23 family metallopeptidase [Alphaproteobacteria bacterium]